MTEKTVITRIIGVAEAVISDVESNYSNRLNYVPSPGGGMMITGANSTLEDVVAWLESKGHTHSVQRKSVK
jgi:hypothetical protein